jgi:DNA-binding response OmpR family regulator
MSECRVLIVEDDEDTREALREALSDAGFAIEQAGDGTAALSRVAQGGVHVVLLDMHLPDMTGQDLLEKLAAIPQAAETRTIVLTGDTRLRLLDYAQGARLLHKPVSLDELEEAVKEACAA